jgi:hypothetical protein
MTGKVLPGPGRVDIRCRYPLGQLDGLAPGVAPPVGPAPGITGEIAVQRRLEPVKQPTAPRRQVGEQARQLTAVPRIQGGLHAVFECLVGKATVNELAPELVNRVITIRIRDTEELGRCRRVRRRTSHEWSIGIICSQGKSKALISPVPGALAAARAPWGRSKP